MLWNNQDWVEKNTLIEQSRAAWTFSYEATQVDCHLEFTYNSWGIWNEKTIVWLELEDCFQTKDSDEDNN